MARTPLLVTQTDQVDRVCAELRRGTPAALTGCGAGGEPATALILALETLDQPRLDATRALAAGPISAALTGRRAEALAIRRYDGDIARICVAQAADLTVLRSLADPALDLAQPLRGPFAPASDGSQGVDAARTALGLCARAGLLPAALVAPVEPSRIDGLGLCALDRADADAELTAGAGRARLIGAADVPLALDVSARLHGFRPSDGGRDHYALVIGAPAMDQPILARLHSECFTGDVLGSLKCDCGPQLRAAIARLAADGGGIVLYLAQEGRGIGMANKLRAYALQDQGYDTVEANHRLGFEDDHRDFAAAAAMLKALNVSAIRLLTNNPAKAASMERAGVRVVERVAHALAPTEQNAAYLQVKAARSGHVL